MQLSITIILVIITALVSISGFSSQKIIDDLIFYPPAVSRRGQWYRFFSSGLIHADYGHLIFNMLALYLFGRSVEDAFVELFGDTGRYIYLGMYVSALLVSLLPTYFRNKDSYQYRSLGASGAVSAVIFAGLMLSPGTEVYLFFVPIPIPGFIFAPLYLLVSFYLDRRGRDNINHSAHIWGSIYGLVFVIFVSRLVGYNAIEAAIEHIKFYMKLKGWTH
ncbi:rhomboid family intramembrane serine protease [Flavisolibacter ginsenosidimutans]|uniref:Rhomboid family intramembrane serine protease n=1 Tax=Flavisolibacter ginsenosidimutans TaxID=661481 RepID=A0A5B8UI75_9BACT|nr:rhomboid family intramembrane serine protease [Flavisolibacter ginsenosidimutans]QEC56354.1 rhomboid family intramembrane serine protease [Flavisolibacter ginsenosidimutans]